MLTSTRRAISYPDPLRSDRPDIPLHIKNVVDAADVDVLYNQGTDAARQAAAHQASGGRVWFCTDTGFLWWDDGADWHEIQGPSLKIPVVALASWPPADPYDGQTVVLELPTTYNYLDPTHKLRWQLQYNAAEGVWDYIGGQRLENQVLSQSASGSTTSYTDAGTLNCAITIPVHGDYYCQVGAKVLTNSDTNSGVALVSYDVGAVAALDNDAYIAYTAIGAGNSWFYQGTGPERLKTNIAAAAVIKAKARGTVNAGTLWANPTLYVRPYRIYTS